MTVDQMIEHTKAVRRGAPNILLGRYDVWLLRQRHRRSKRRPNHEESGVDAVKLQGGREMFDIIKAVADAGVPVMSHVGLCPHFVHRYGGFKMQGRTAEDALKIVDNAKAIEEAGAIGMEIEAIPYEVGKAVDDAVSIFTFSIGAGAAGTCQLLNGYDLIGAFDTFKPKFAKRYGNVVDVAVKAFEDYAEDVRSGAPDADYFIK